MFGIRAAAVRRWVDKLAVDSELQQGRSNAQLMLTNYDLRPVEPERRQWRSRNFVAFWIADSFNIVSFFVLNRASLYHRAAGVATIAPPESTSDAKKE
ncbi:hypothetical protein VTN02DRAFT_3327 [Thermoascus thermophilus]